MKSKTYLIEKEGGDDLPKVSLLDWVIHWIITITMSILLTSCHH